jgi:hypothetical protein
MTFMHKLSRRLAQNDLLPLVALLLVPACAGEPASVQYDVSAIHVSPRSVVLAPNDAHQFTAMGDAAGLQDVPVPVTWSAEGGVIDENGRFVAGAADGTYRVHATHATLQWLTDSSTAIVISAGPPTALRISPRDATVAVNQIATLSAYALFGDGDSAEIEVGWSADAGSIEPLGQQAQYSNDQAGTFQVRAALDALADSVTVTVTVAAVAGVSVSPATDTLNVDETRQLVAVARDAAGNPLAGRQFTWTTGSASIASVSGTGVVTARGAGTVVITVRCEGQSATAAITVLTPPPPPPPPPPAAVASVTVTPTSPSLSVGDTVRLSAVARDSGGNVLSGRSFTWTVANGVVASVTTSGTVTALGVGITTVTVTCEGRSATATVTVTAPPPPPPPGGSEPVFLATDALIYGETFDSYTSTTAMIMAGGGPWDVGGSSTALTAVGGGRNGGKAMTMTKPAGTSGPVAQRNISGAPTLFFAQYWFKLTTVGSDPSPHAKWLIVNHTAEGGAGCLGGAVTRYQFALSTDLPFGKAPPSSRFAIRGVENSECNGPVVGDNQVGYFTWGSDRQEAAPVLATDPDIGTVPWGAINDGTWHRWTMELQTGTSAYVKLWLDGNLYWNSVGQAMNMPGEPTSFKFEMVSGTVSTPFTVWFDDLVLWTRSK